MGCALSTLLEPRGRDPPARCWRACCASADTELASLRALTCSTSRNDSGSTARRSTSGSSASTFGNCGVCSTRATRRDLHLNRRAGSRRLLTPHLHIELRKRNPPHRRRGSPRPPRRARGSAIPLGPFRQLPPLHFSYHLTCQMEPKGIQQI